VCWGIKESFERKDDLNPQSSVWEVTHIKERINVLLQNKYTTKSYILQGSIQRRKTELSGDVSQFLENLADGQKQKEKRKTD